MRLLEKRTCFREWRLASIIPDREAFFAFLQDVLPRVAVGQHHS